MSDRAPRAAGSAAGPGRPRGRRGLALLQWLLTPAIAIALLAYVGPGRVVETFALLRPGWALASAAAFVVASALSAAGLWILLRSLAPVSPVTYIRAYLTGWAVNLAVPGQAGDAAQLLVLKRHGIPLSRSAAAYATDKATSIGLVGLVASFGLVRYLPDLAPRFTAIALLLLLALGVLLGLAVLERVGRGQGRVAAFAGNLSQGFLEFREHPAPVAANLLVTALRVLVLGVCYQLALRAFGVTLPFVAAATIPIMSTLVAYLPLTAGGIGTVEASAVYLFGREGIAEPVVLSVYILVRCQQYGLAALLLLLSTRLPAEVVSAGGSPAAAADVEPAGE